MDWRKQVCEMAYHRTNIVREIVVEINDGLTLETVWREYSKQKYGNEYIQPYIIFELKKITVPSDLFVAPGIYTWFAYSFPECEITFTTSS